MHVFVSCLSEHIRTGDLFAKQHEGAGSPDQADKMGGEVSFIIAAFLFSGGAKGLTWRTAGPYGAVVGPTSEPKGV